ncbi:ArsR/SmtB family transcription factor [Parasphingopyxis marina]|uniref:Helix-turn-helix transcriptional regulator n=1 Tax=Parasphingopyxis marina TaxID=2761622 RepID=A0A842HW14_9SPHN|nr:metalloregulator ArsR/SmtB family transcription factor [Parasphingopyxis marina]MBC2777095.1 helix-turn-helix transcriptional regulator [Parasphingopyxis marina]
MTITDTLSFAAMAENASKAASLLKALSNEHRLLVLCHLVAESELTAGELVVRSGLSQSALSQHLGRLREEGLIDFRRDAQRLHYRIADPNAERVLGLLHDIYCPDLESEGEQEKVIS